MEGFVDGAEVSDPEADTAVAGGAVDDDERFVLAGPEDTWVVEAGDGGEGAPCAGAAFGGGGRDVDDGWFGGAAEAARGAEMIGIRGGTWLGVWGGGGRIWWVADVGFAEEGFLVETFGDDSGDEEVVVW